ncbi:MAG: hypothetical protein AAFX81_16090 [Pseudomonadota bacterium]
MTGSAGELLTEVQVAHWFGFSRFRHFQRARRLRPPAVPAPTLDLADGPRWSRADLEKFVGGSRRPTNADEAFNLELLEQP